MTDHEGLTYIKERRRDLATGADPSSHAALWEIYAGAVAVGIRAAMGAQNSDIAHMAVFCGGVMPEFKP